MWFLSQNIFNKIFYLMEIKDIKSQLSIQTILDHYSLKPTRSNLLPCPFHPDKTPSLQLYPKTNTWHCFGCGKGTDQIDFIQLMEKSSTHKAIIKAKSFITINHINSKPMQQAISTKTLTQAQRIKGLTAAFKYFARSLKYTSKAQEYLQSRAIDYHKIIAGYDNHNFHQTKTADKELQELYLALGLIYPDKLGRPGCYHSRFDGCIVLPGFDEQGNIVYLEGRKTDAAENEGGHYKLPGGHHFDGDYAKLARISLEGARAPGNAPR